MLTHTKFLSRHASNVETLIFLGKSSHPSSLNFPSQFSFFNGEINCKLAKNFRSRKKLNLIKRARNQQEKKQTELGIKSFVNQLAKVMTIIFLLLPPFFNAHTHTGNFIRQMLLGRERERVCLRADDEKYMAKGKTYTMFNFT
jgi:hypothetical protein